MSCYTFRGGRRGGMKLSQCSLGWTAYNFWLCYIVLVKDGIANEITFRVKCKNSRAALDLSQKILKREEFITTSITSSSKSLYHIFFLLSAEKNLSNSDRWKLAGLSPSEKFFSFCLPCVLPFYVWQYLLLAKVLKRPQCHKERLSN